MMMRRKIDRRYTLFSANRLEMIDVYALSIDPDTRNLDTVCGKGKVRRRVGQCFQSDGIARACEESARRGISPSGFRASDRCYLL